MPTFVIAASILATGLFIGVVIALLMVRRQRRRADRLMDEAAARRVVQAWTEWGGRGTR